MGQKRRRLALSCVACRRRKVKCDRTFPTCVRCQKSGVTCDYVPYTSQSNTTLPTPSEESPHVAREGSANSWTEEANEWHVRSKQHENARPYRNTSPAAPAPRSTARTSREDRHRTSNPSTYFMASGSRPLSTDALFGVKRAVAPEAATDKNSLQGQYWALLRGKGLKTQYFGPSHAGSLLLQFEELSRFVKDILQRLPTLQKAREEFKRQRREARPSLVLPDPQTLVSLIPDRPKTDARVQEYFKTIETTYRVLHAPSFFQKYKAYWGSSSEATEAFLVQLLLVCACVNCVVPDEPAAFMGPSSVGRDRAIKWIEVCETWLDLQSQKHMTLEVFQVQVLIVIAKKMNCVKVKREWTVAGHLLRMAMAIGLHREPSYLNTNVSVFDQEMRRRLWFTILELEVQATLDRGMTASLGPFDWDCLPPSNIHDEDLDPDMERLPPARPITTFTRTSFLYLAQQHLPLRLEIISRMNSIRGCLESDSVIDLDQKIRQILDALPKWTDTAAQAMSRDLSEMVLYEYLLLIHQPFAAQAEGQTKHFYSRLARRSVALTTLKTYTDMAPSSALTFEGLRSDLFRASLAICHDIAVTGTAKDDMLQDKPTLMSLVEQAVDIMENRIRHLGQGFHSYWLTSSALALVRSKLIPGRSIEDLAQQTADRVATLHQYMMKQQSLPPGFGRKGEEDTAMSTANTLVGMSGQTPITQGLPEIDPFGALRDDFNVFSDTLFDFDMPDIWGMGGFPQLQ
ncbi:hypothetical protein HRR83_006371 [Exophiala dermatitidis]|uniref:Zn(2)-C6 fungal-type domain-containing protein n=2 Tax=Exophiala dermatitidis TaxID=5970 RepID=H6CA46_EXODN|nr:uncharacterized protein HMPREF1120_07985 [Exophiala dermatitidis NIH/UT8656]KAJ4509375.1 hypothetical protein HRR73_007229 [Exophiala dermatitidis]EHY60010.1 hypothetical protein HMPREF1120_07985 [Exophiala dermatitidis NIH/UT8656]KAJ4509562.1 hypothetical protein HRR74_007343 [Exophiala dermatitidis]KAJ4530563.1 hypothetical protein HRR76_008270 [Exophiala dermatitidis]KAJ4545267.1 hypothetical protein HRR77_005117 [Exophiala dermatitidis]